MIFTEDELCGAALDADLKAPRDHYRMSMEDTRAVLRETRQILKSVLDDQLALQKMLQEPDEQFDRMLDSQRRSLMNRLTGNDYVTLVTRMYLRRHRRDMLWEMPYYALQVKEHGFKWGGVLFQCDTGHLYLLEDELEHERLNGMGERMRRTVDFIKFCTEAVNQQAELISARDFEQHQLFIPWAGLNRVTRVYGVVDGSCFTQKMLDTADSEGFLCVLPEDHGAYGVYSEYSAYEIRPPASGDSRETSVLPMVFTEDQLWDAALDAQAL